MEPEPSNDSWKNTLADAAAMRKKNVDSPQPADVPFDYNHNADGQPAEEPIETMGGRDSASSLGIDNSNLLRQALKPKSADNLTDSEREAAKTHAEITRLTDEQDAEDALEIMNIAGKRD